MRCRERAAAISKASKDQLVRCHFPNRTERYHPSIAPAVTPASALEPDFDCRR